MIPILFAKTCKVWPDDFQNNGLGLIAHALKCEVTEERNGPLELELTYPANGPLAKVFDFHQLILAKPNNVDDDHLFRIYDISKDVVSGTITVNAYSRTNDLGSSMVGDVTSVQRDPQAVLDLMQKKMINKLPYEFTMHTDIPAKDTEVDISEYKYKNPLECLVGTEWSFIHRFGGEVRRRNTGIDILGKRGFDRGNVVRPAKNLDGFKYNISAKGLVTAILPWCKYVDDKQIEHVVEGDVVMSKHVNDYPIVFFQSIDFSQEKIDKKDGTQEDIKTKEQLMNHRKVKHWFSNHDNIDKPNTSVDVNIKQLADTGYYSKETLAELEKFSVCDTATFYVPSLDIDMSMKLTKIRFDVLSEKTVELSAGSTHSSLYEKITVDTTTKKLEELKSYTKQIESNLREYVTTATNGVNKVYYTSTLPEGTEHKVGDIVWHQENSEHTQLYVWDGHAWVAEAKPLDKEKITEAVNNAVKSAQDKLRADVNNDLTQTQRHLEEQIDNARRANARETDRLESRITNVDSNSKVSISEIKNELGQLSTKVITSDGFKTNLVSTLQTDTGIVTDIVNNMMIGGSKNLIDNPTNFTYFTDSHNLISAEGQSVTMIDPLRDSDVEGYKKIEVSVRSKDLVNGYGKNPWNSFTAYETGVKLKLTKKLEAGKKYTLFYNLTKEPRIIPDVKNLLFNTYNKVNPTSTLTNVNPKVTNAYDVEQKTTGTVLTFSNEDIKNAGKQTGHYGFYWKLTDPLPIGKYVLSFATKGLYKALRVDYLDTNTKSVKLGVYNNFADNGIRPEEYNPQWRFNHVPIDITSELANRVAYIRIWINGPQTNKFVFGYMMIKKEAERELHSIGATPTSWSPGSDDYNVPRIAEFWGRDKESNWPIRLNGGLTNLTPGTEQLTTFTTGPSDDVSKQEVTINLPDENADYKLWNWVLMEGDWSKEDIINGDVDGVKKPLSRLIEKKLADSWAISHLNSAGDLVSQINLNKSGVRIKGENILLDGDVQVSGKAFLDGAVIKNGSIGTAQIADATITNAKIQGLDAFKITGLEAVIGKVVTQDLIADRIRAKQSLQIGDDAWLYLRNDMLQIQKGNGTNTGLSIEVSGRILGPTQFNGKPSRHKYSPVMTNAWVENGIQGAGGYPTVYGVRWIGLVSWKTGKYLHIDDGATDNHHYYVKLEAAQDQSPIENGLRG